MSAEAEHGEQVRARLAAATPGPWRADDERALWENSSPSWVVSLTDGDGSYLGDLFYVVHDDALDYGSPAPQEQADAELIAHAPTDLARLLDRAERAERERDEARGALAVAERRGAERGWDERVDVADHEALTTLGCPLPALPNPYRSQP